jgi:hypothetical protein
LKYPYAPEVMKMTRAERIVVSGYTGFLMCEFGELHEDIERRADRSVFTHELGGEAGRQMVQRLYMEDFMALAREVPTAPEKERGEQ